jgi:hypothetical protein
MDVLCARGLCCLRRFRGVAAAPVLNKRVGIQSAPGPFRRPASPQPPADRVLRLHQCARSRCRSNSRSRKQTHVNVTLGELDAEDRPAWNENTQDKQKTLAFAIELLTQQTASHLGMGRPQGARA